ncbi:MAG: dihydrofolate reductase family protein [Cyanobacteria bacterium J06626_23]
MKVTYYVASSLDGYIAKADGDVSWLDNLGISMAETGYGDFFSTVDALVMGRKTYEFVYEYGSWPYGDKPTWVCRRNAIAPIEGCNLKNAAEPLGVVAEANALGVGHLWLVGGGVLASALIQNRLLTHVSISQMPILLGGGIRLFADLPDSILVQNQTVRQRASGSSQLEFELRYA